MKITIKKNRSVYPYRIKVSNQYENKTNSIEFDLDVPNGNKYLFVEIDGRTIPYPLENEFEISAGLSWTAGEHRACVVVSNVEIKDTINKEDALFISDEFVLVVDKNFINPDDVAGGGLPEPLKILYDDLMSLKNEIEKKLQNGEFNGESAYEIAVRLGFKGTEQEWIDSLRYDHSDEFQKIALQVEQKATDAENAAQSASQSASESKESAAQAAQSAIDGANSAKESAKSALEGATSATEAANSAKQSASSASGSAQSAVEAASSAKEGATSALQSANSAKESADSAAQSAESASQGAVSAEQAKIYASEALQSKNDAFISAQETKTAEAHAKASEANSKTSETNSKLSETNARTSELNAQKSAENIQASAEQIEQNKLDIQDLRNNPVIDETVLEKLAIKDKSQGNPCVIDDSADWRLQDLKAYGQSEQFTTTGKNLLHGTKRVQGYNIMGFINDLKPNTQYTYSNSGITDPKASFKLTAYNSQNKSEIDLTKGYIRNSKETFTTPENVSDYEELYLVGNYADAGKNCINNQFQVEEGAVSSPYEPYTGGKPSPSPEYPQEVISKTVSEIKITGNNLIKIEDANKLQNNIYVCREKGFFLTKGIKYVFSFNGQSATALYVVKHGEKDAIHYVYQKNTIEYTPTENGLYYFNIYNQSGVTDEQLNSIRLNIEKDYGYEPYKEQLVTLSSPITLRGVQVQRGGNVTIDGKQYVSDVVKDKDGVIGVERKSFIQKIENIKGGNFYEDTKTVRMLIPYKVGKTIAYASLCNRSINLKRSFWNEDIVGYYNDLSNIVIRFSKENFPTLDSVNTYFNENETYVLLFNSETTFEPLPETDQQAIKAIKSYYHNTIIQTGAYTESTYVADPKLYIDKKLEPLNAVQSQLLKLESEI